MTLRSLLGLPVLALLMAITAGCAADGEPPGTAPTSASSSDASPIPSATLRPPLTGSSGAPDEAAVQAAVADLAGRLGVPPEDVQVVQLSEVTWSDGSLGCPQPGISYTQALVDGHLLVLEVAGQRYEYHAGGSGSLSYCADPHPPVGSSTASGSSM